MPVVQVGLNITWTSDIDGLLCMGAFCDSKILSPGVHTITERVTDPFGASAEAAILLKINKPTPPAAYITAPATGATFYSSQQVHLIGSGSAPNEPVIPDSNLSWSSSASGTLGKGSSLWTPLPLGTQTLTLTALDNFGNTGSASVQVNIVPGADYPTVKILQPAAYWSGIGLGQSITFQGSGSDPVDGPLSGSELRWTSSIDGFLGVGAVLTTTLSAASCGPTAHQITLTGTNTHGIAASSTIVVYVGPIC